ncbi:cell wall-binding repeat-containing protein [Bacillus suaedae]|uniref:Cell wall-binding repeat-containing protein n=1 Tax=Halalkalibacter suaedae TaxID=2822140 RepID=A0A940WY62_9BACI|nr:cell wall-binding repeat-containing protein [Bacillus suaedae]MBP3950124.1 cell wall-binding repeat-containing protein [Bacillus suaedae]
MKNFIPKVVFILTVLLFTFPLFSFAEECQTGTCTNPTYQEINRLLTEKALEYHIPPEIVKAVAFTESDWDQFKNNQPHISEDGGIGIMQITDNENQFNFNREKLKYDITYNIEAGLKVLNYNFHERSGIAHGGDLPAINEMNPNVIEHWYFAVMAYNGRVQVNSPVYKDSGNRNMNSYQDKVFTRIENTNPGLSLARELIEVKVSDLEYRTGGTLTFKKDYQVSSKLHSTNQRFQRYDLVVAKPKLNIRTNPLTTSRSLGEVGNENVLTVVETFKYDQSTATNAARSNNFVWYPVEASNNRNGYVASSYLQPFGKRIKGPDRYATAVEISKQGWDQASTVVLTTGQNFPDALSGAPLAYKLDAPILVTKSDQLVASTKAEIQRLKATNVVILGSEAAVSGDVEKSLRSMGISIKRIGGSDRYETAKLIADELGSSKTTAIVASGRNFPDALAVAPYAAQNGYPILLSKEDQLPTSTEAALKAHNIQETIVVGGTAVISNSIKNQLPKATRISGADRYKTAVAVLKELNHTSDQGQVYIATGSNFADALTGSVLAAKKGSPVLLTGGWNVVDGDVLDVIGQNEIDFFNILGGSSAVSEDEINRLNIQ